MLRTKDYTKLSCGHWVSTKSPVETTPQHDSTELELPKEKPSFPFTVELFPFQKETVDLMNQHGRLLVAHEMGLGKTICALRWMSENIDKAPFVCLVKSGARIQWLREIKKLVGFAHIPTQPILSGDDPIFPGAKCYIVSIDSIASIGPEKFEHCKTVILDEAQTIKNIEAKRTRAVFRLCKGKEHFFALSGTPIKNRIDEYYPVLHLLSPERFSSRASFIMKYAHYSSSAYGVKTTGLRNPAQFFADTYDLVFRKTREEVLPELPKIFRQFSFIDMSEMAQEAYDRTVEEFGDYYSEHGEDADSYTNILAYLAKMRHIVGLSKVGACIDHVTDFLLSTDRKITIFCHHKDVASIVRTKVDEWLKMGGYAPSLALTSDLNAIDRQALVDKFKTPECRVLIASTLAAGESLNLQFCSDFVMLERQWNPSNEEQAEGRFSRIGSVASQVNGTYIVAVGSIDEYFADLVEQKRALLKHALDKVDEDWHESDLVRELAETILKKGYKKWQMPK